MHEHHAVCLEIREPERWSPGAELSLWRLETQRNRVAAVARVGAVPGFLAILTPMRDTDFDGTPAVGSALPVLWLPANSWPAAIRRSKKPNHGNARRLENGGLFVSEEKPRMRQPLPSRREKVSA
jgi:hypothetical protein